MSRQVILVFRKPHPNVFSIEYLFSEIKKQLQGGLVPVKSFTLRKMSEGLLNRVLNTLSLIKFKGEILHITGDVHYAILGGIFSKRVLTIHDLGFLKGRNGMAFQVLKLFWVSLPCKFADIITVVSEATKQEVLAQVRISPSKIRVIYNFIDDIYHQPFSKPHFNKSCPRILQIGTAFNKNIPRLADALTGIPCHMVFIGRLDEETEKLLKERRISYETLYKISNEELREEYIKADLLAYVSTLEGFGMPILEAQACGLPVLTSNCSSMPEVAADAAIFADPFDVNSIKEGVLKILYNDELRQEVIIKGFENIKRFSKEKVAEQYLQIYRELGL